MEYYVSLVVLGIVLAASLGMLVVSVVRWNVTGFMPLAILNGITGAWTVFSLLRLSSSSLAGKLFWDDFTFLYSALGAGLLLFSFHFLGQAKRLPRWAFAGLAMPAVFTLLIALSGPWQALLRVEPRLVQAGLGVELQYGLGPWYYLELGLFAALGGAAWMWVGWNLIRSPDVHRRSSILVLVGLGIPLFSLLVANPLDHQNPTRLLAIFTLSNGFLAWGVYARYLSRFLLFTRDLVIEQSTEGVLVLDQRMCILEANPEALKILGKSSREVLGQPLGAALEGLAEVADSPQAVQASVEFWRDWAHDGHEYALRFIPVHRRRLWGKQSNPALQGWALSLYNRTASNQLRRELLEREQVSQSLIENAQDGMLLIQDDRIVYCNRQLAGMVGQPLGQVQGGLFSDLLSQEFREDFLRNILSPQAGQAGLRLYETSLLRKDGLTVTVEIQFSEISYHGARALAGVVRDIGQRKRIEKELQGLNQRLGNFFAQSQDGILQIDESGVVLEWNPALEEISGLARRAVVNHFFPEVMFSLLPVELRTAQLFERVREVLLLVLQTGETRLFKIHPPHIIRADGARRLVDLAIFPIRTVRGFQIGAIVRDMTAQAELRKAYEQDELVMQSVLDHSDLPLWFKDLEGRYQVANRAFVRASQKTTPQEILGKTDYDLWPPQTADRFIEAGRGVMESLHEVVLKEFRPAADGEVWVKTVQSPILDSAGKLIGVAGQVVEGAYLKRIAAILDQGEAGLRAVASPSPDMIWVADPDGRFTFVNERWCSFTGREAAGELGEAWRDHLHPEDIALFAGVFAGQPGEASLEFRMRGAGDELRWIFCSAVRIPASDGIAAGWVGSCTDITAQKEAEQALAQKNSRYEAIFNNPRIGIGVVDAQGQYLQVNACFARMLGYTPEDLLGLKNIQITHPEDVEGTRVLFEAMNSGVIRDFYLEKRYVRKDGSIFWGSLSAMPVYEAVGSLAFSVGFIQDISERKAIAERLRESEELYRSIVHASPDSIFITAVPGTIQMASPSALRLLGYPQAGPLVGRDLADFILEADRGLLAAFSQDILQMVSPGRLEVRVLRSDGFPLNCEATGELVRGDDGLPAGLIFLFRDVSERKDLETAQRHRMNELEALRATMNDLSAELELSRLLGAIVERLVGLLDAYEGEMALFDEEEGVLIEVVSYSRDRDYTGYRLKLGEGAMGRVAVSKETLIIPDYAEWEGASPQFEAVHRSVIAVPLLVGGELLGAITVGGHPTLRPFNESDERLISMFAQQAAIAIQNAKLFSEVKRLAITDSLTGVHNRRYFFDQATRELHRSQRYREPLALLILDVDHFKSVNDRYGHLLGDEVLRAVGRVLKQSLRDIDLVGRYGGEEFVVLLPGTNREGAIASAQRLCKNIAAHQLESGQESIQVTVSIGLACCPEAKIQLDELINAADQAMYRAKQAGRARISE